MSTRKEIMAKYRAEAEAEYGSLEPGDFETGAVIEPGANTFEVMGLPDAKERGRKVQLAYLIKRIMEARGLSQTRVAELSGLAQPDISKMVRGQLSGFSSDRLLDILLALGSDVELRVKVPAGKLRKGEAVRAGRFSLVSA